MRLISIEQNCITFTILNTFFFLCFKSLITRISERTGFSNSKYSQKETGFIFQTAFSNSFKILKQKKQKTAKKNSFQNLPKISKNLCRKPYFAQHFSTSDNLTAWKLGTLKNLVVPPIKVVVP